jgi:hypothetical protein
LVWRKDELGPLAAALALVVNVLVVKPLWQLTGHRNYAWFVGPAVAATYALVFAFYLRGPSAKLPRGEFLLVQVLAILTIWGWLDAAFRVINCGLDRSMPADVAAQVIDVNRRKGSYSLTLSGAPAFNRAELSVDVDVYNRARLGAPVVVTWRKGALGEGWCGRNGVRVEAPPALR